MRALIAALLIGAFCVYGVVADTVPPIAQSGNAFRAEAVDVFAQMPPSHPPGEGGTPIEPPGVTPHCTPGPTRPCLPFGEGGTPIEPPHNGD